MAGKRRARRLALAATLAVPALMLGTMAETGTARAAGLPAGAPDVGTILRGITRTMPQAPVQAPPEATERRLSPSNKSARIFVREIRFETALYPDWLLKRVVKAYTGRWVTVGELEQAAEKIDAFYRKHDYLARTYLPPQTVHDGVVVMVVQEAWLDAVKVNRAKGVRLKPETPAKIVTGQQRVNIYVHPQDLETGTLLLNDLPGISAQTVLRPGAQSGDTEAVVSVNEGPLFSGSAIADNWGGRSVGNKRLLGTLAVNDPFGWGDRTQAIAMKSSDSTYGSATYTLPVGASGLTLSANGSLLYYDLDLFYPTLKATGEAATGSLTARYPFLRRRMFSIYGSLGYERRHMVDYVDGQASNERDLDTVTLGVASNRSDAWGGGGVTSGGVGLAVGRVNLSSVAAAAAADAAGPRTAGGYSKITASVSRNQRLAARWSALASINGQWANCNLDSSEQFSLGGPSGIRAFPVSEASGDSGWQTSLELRYTALESLQLKGFYDVGGIMQHHDTWSGWSTGGQPNSYLLQGLGAGLSWVPLPAVSLQLALAHPLGGNPGHDASGNNNDGTKPGTEVWMQGAVNF